MNIRPATREDASAIWSIIGPTIRAGETYALSPGLTEEEGLEYWSGTDRETFVVEDEGEILGTYYIRANQPGGGDHVANCGYMTAASATGRGAAKRMCQHSLDYARSQGFRAMQFQELSCTLRTDTSMLWSCIKLSSVYLSMSPVDVLTARNATSA